jgi:biopolymer transport protein ExbD
MRRRRHRGRAKHEVELNLAAMLDMAFQLLAFFILTFRPSPVEGELALNLPPPRAVARPVEAGQPTEGPGQETVDTSFMVGVRADGEGYVAGVQLDFGGMAFTGPANEEHLRYLDGRLRDIFSSQSEPYDQVVVSVDPTLRFDELMKIVDVCLKQKMPDGQPLSKLSFAEMPPGNPPP